MFSVFLALGAVGLILLLAKVFLKPGPRPFVENGPTAFLVLGSGTNLQEQAAQDLEIYREAFPKVEKLHITDRDHLRAQVSGKPYRTIYIHNAFDSSGKVIWPAGHTGEVLEILEACADSDASFIFMASGIEENQTEIARDILEQASDVRERIKRVQVALILERGPEFPNFLRRFTQLLQQGEPPMIAWLRVRPQDAGGPPLAYDIGPHGLVLG